MGSPIYPWLSRVTIFRFGTPHSLTHREHTVVFYAHDARLNNFKASKGADTRRRKGGVTFLTIFLTFFTSSSLALEKRRPVPWRGPGPARCIIQLHAARRAYSAHVCPRTIHERHDRITQLTKASQTGQST